MAISLISYSFAVLVASSAYASSNPASQVAAKAACRTSFGNLQLFPGGKPPPVDSNNLSGMMSDISGFTPPNFSPKPSQNGSRGNPQASISNQNAGGTQTLGASSQQPFQQFSSMIRHFPGSSQGSDPSATVSSSQNPIQVPSSMTQSMNFNGVIPFPTVEEGYFPNNSLSYGSDDDQFEASILSKMMPNIPAFTSANSQHFPSTIQFANMQTAIDQLNGNPLSFQLFPGVSNIQSGMMSDISDFTPPNFSPKPSQNGSRGNPQASISNQNAGGTQSFGVSSQQSFQQPFQQFSSMIRQFPGSSQGSDPSATVSSSQNPIQVPSSMTQSMNFDGVIPFPTVEEDSFPNHSLSYVPDDDQFEEDYIPNNSLSYGSDDDQFEGSSQMHNEPVGPSLLTQNIKSFPSHGCNSQTEGPRNKPFFGTRNHLHLSRSSEPHVTFKVMGKGTPSDEDSHFIYMSDTSSKQYSQMPHFKHGMQGGFPPFGSDTQSNKPNESKTNDNNNSGGGSDSGKILGLPKYLFFILLASLMLVTCFIVFLVMKNKARQAQALEA